MANLLVQSYRKDNPDTKLSDDQISIRFAEENAAQLQEIFKADPSYKADMNRIWGVTENPASPDSGGDEPSSWDWTKQAYSQFMKGLAEQNIVTTAPETIAIGTSALGHALDLPEEGYWAAVQDLGTSEAVESYLRRYPRGAFKAEADALLSDIRERPQREAEAAEAALRLDRNTRRAIQRALVLLGYDTRGIDGIFGRGTRNGIRNWQGDNNLFASGYLDRPQLAMLNAQAEDRRAELEEEAQERARLDAAREGTVWRRTERTDTPEAYRSYLERYPDGLYVEDAQRRLRQFERQARREARAEERLLWDEVRQNGSAESYRLYLERYPNGSFVGEAQAALAELEAQVDTARLTEIENQVLGNPVIRLLAERRLAELGLDPGRVDGQFDENTRRAVRRFQRARDIGVTGYVDQATAVRMLAEAIGR